jgi:hypothetical protein
LQRFLSTVIVLGLLVATATAFAVTEGLKLTKSPISRTRVDKVLSPAGTIPSATIKFWLRKRDVLTLSIVNSHRHEVDRLVDGVTAHRKWNSFVWSGRTSSGSVAADGSYFAKVHLSQAHRTILLPNAIRIDTKAPAVLAAEASRTTISPDGDGQADSIKIKARFSESSHAVLYVLGRRLIYARFARERDSITWYGNGRKGGPPLPQGTYRLRVGAVDPARNVTGPARGKVVVVHVRYIALARDAVTVKAGTRFGIGVDTDAKAYEWQLDGATGLTDSDVLIVRAPARLGRYQLVVVENGHRATASVFVVPRL